MIDTGSSPTVIPTNPKGKVQIRIDDDRRRTTRDYDSIRLIPLTIADFNGSAEFYQYFRSFIDARSLFIICIGAVEFDQRTTNKQIEDLFLSSTCRETVELLDLLQLICDRASKNRAILIVPVVTGIDLYDKQNKSNR